MIAHVRLMAAYNRWANARLYEACEALDEKQFHADRGAFFKSVCGTLNHLLVTDRIWLSRFTGEGGAPDRLDAILFVDLPSLRSARVAEDERIAAFADGLSPEALERFFQYRRVTSPEWFEQRLDAALMHLFNHQTHHRGQLHAILTGLRVDAPSLDLLLFQRDAGLGARPVAAP